MRILIFILGLLFIGSLNAQSSFYKLYSSNGFDIGKGVAEYSDSSFLICGSSTSWGGSTQMVLLKLDSTGAYQWSNQYGGNESDGANRVLYNEAEGVFAVGLGILWVLGILMVLFFIQTNLEMKYGRKVLASQILGIF